MSNNIWWKGANNPYLVGMEDRCEICKNSGCKIMHGVLNEEFVHKVLCYIHAKEFYVNYNFYGCGCGG